MEYDLRPIVGKKQILRLLKENRLKSIQIATDVESDYANLILTEAKQCGVKTEVRGTRKQLADTYGIEVPCGSVGFLKSE